MRKQLRKQDCWTLDQRISSPAWQSWAASREAALFFCLKISQPHSPCQLGVGFFCATYNQAYKICPAHVQPGICHRLWSRVTGQMIADHAYRKTPLLTRTRTPPLLVRPGGEASAGTHARRRQCRGTGNTRKTGQCRPQAHRGYPDAVEYARATCQMTRCSGASLVFSKDCNT